MSKVIPLARPFVGAEEYEAVRRVLEGRHLAQGPQAVQLEKDVAAFIETSKNVLAVSSGGSALYLALMALGVKPGDEVVVPSFVFPAAAQATVWIGAVPVPADVDPQTMAIVPETVASVVSARTKAIVVVHPFGIPARVEDIQRAVSGRDIYVVEDSACALGGMTAGGQSSGTVGDIGCFSLHPRKSATSGEGGLVVAGGQLASKIATMRDYGRTGAGAGDIFSEVGLNFRLSDIAASIARVQVGRVTASIETRRNLVARYRKGLAGFGGVTVPSGYDQAGNTFQSFVVEVERDPETIRKRLADDGIQAGIAAHNLTDQAFFRQRVGNFQRCPVSERLAAKTLALPLFDEMDFEQVDRVVAALGASFQ